MLCSHGVMQQRCHLSSQVCRDALLVPHGTDALLECAGASLPWGHGSCNSSAGEGSRDVSVYKYVMGGN